MPMSGCLGAHHGTAVSRGRLRSRRPTLSRPGATSAMPAASLVTFPDAGRCPDLGISPGDSVVTVTVADVADKSRCACPRPKGRRLRTTFSIVNLFHRTQNDARPARVPRQVRASTRLCVGRSFFRSVILGAGLALAVALLEAGYATAAVQDLLLTGVERVALRADLDHDAAGFAGAPGLEGIAAAADDGGLTVCRVIALFDFVLFFRGPEGRPLRIVGMT